VSPPDPDPGGAQGSLREQLTLVHHHPGRLRVRAQAFRLRPHEGDRRPAVEEDLAAEASLDHDPVDRVRAALDAEPGIAAFVHNARTGSILVEYEPGLADSETILSRIADAADLEMPSDEAPPPKKPALVAIDAAREVNAIVADLTGQQADLRSLVPLGMAALAAYSFVYHKDARLPRWDNLLYWSYNVFSQLHRREIEGTGAWPTRRGSRPTANEP
jgi:hypothetical protein